MIIISRSLCSSLHQMKFALAFEDPGKAALLINGKGICHQETRDTLVHKETLVNLGVLCALVAEKTSLIKTLFIHFRESPILDNSILIR